MHHLLSDEIVGCCSCWIDIVVTDTTVLLSQSLSRRIRYVLAWELEMWKRAFEVCDCFRMWSQTLPFVGIPNPFFCTALFHESRHTSPFVNKPAANDGLCGWEGYKVLGALHTLTSMSHTGEIYELSRDCQVRWLRIFLKKPLLIQEEDRGEQGLEGTISLRDYSLRLEVYDNYPSMSIVVTTYFSTKVV